MLDAFLNKKTSLEVISGNVRFTWDEILQATSWFATDLIVGEGGSSIVYRGKLDNGEDVAVKRAKKVNLITNARVYKLFLFSVKHSFGSHLIKQENYSFVFFDFRMPMMSISLTSRFRQRLQLFSR